MWGNTREEVREPYFIEEQNLRFQGQYLDRETGLHFNTFRFYDPDIGRFTTTDPIDLMGGFNLYQYAPNPVTWIDPFGWACGHHGHHSDPKFMGGKHNQNLTKLTDTDHKQLHRDMNDFLVGKTKNINGGTVHMRPQRGNSGKKIRLNFTRTERLRALADFYKGKGAQYKDAVFDFFIQHQGLK